MGEGAVPNVWVGSWKPITHTRIALPTLNKRRGVYSYCNLKCHALLIPMGGPPLSEQKWRRKCGLVRVGEEKGKTIVGI